MLTILLKLAPGAILGAALTFSALVAFNAIWENPQVRADERDRIEAAARARALSLIEQRGRDNAEISDLDMAGLCGELGGRWVPDESRCD